MSEQLPRQNEEITPEQATEFVEKIESLKLNLDKMPAEESGGSKLYRGTFTIGRGSTAEIKISEHPEEMVEGSPTPEMKEYKLVVSTQDNKGKIATRTEDKFSVQHWGNNLSDISAHYQKIFIRSELDAPFEEVGGDSRVFRELVEEYGRDNINKAGRAYVEHLAERLKLNAAMGINSSTFTQEDFKEVMDILEQIG